MAPQSPKRPPRPRVSGQPSARKKPDVELPFDDVEDMTPLRADDPRPQRVAQIPSGLPRRGREGDEVMPPGTSREPELEDGFQPAFLYVERGPGMGQLSPIRQGITLIGRASTAGLRLQHPSISRKHAEVSRRAERFFIKDLGSQNGTYVNGVRIDGEAELFAGDEIVVGTAQLRLRAQGAQTGGQEGARGSGARSAEKARTRRAGSSMVFVAIAAGVVGSGLAAVGMFVFFKVSRGPSFEELPAARAAAAPTASAPAAAPPEPAAPTAPAPSAALPADPGSPAIPALEPLIPASPPGLPTPPAPPPHISVGESPAAPPGTTAAPATTPEAVAGPAEPAPPTAPDRQRHPARRGERLASSASPARGDLGDPPRDNRAAAPPANPTVMARYENGDVAAAIELAKKKGEKELAARLVRFQTQYEAGQRALAARDEAAALRNLDAALKLDEQFSGGWGKYNAELRRTLSSLYTMSGARLVAAGNEPAAYKAFTSALQYDPDNATAKAQLGKLSPGAAPPPAPKPPASRRADIDAAFGK